MEKQISKLCYQLAYIVLSCVGALLSTHLFTKHVFNRDFYVYYTNISNFVCLGIMIVCFIKNLSCLKRNQLFKPTKSLNYIKTTASILIAITFLIYNTLLADFSLNNYFFNLYNLLYHVVLPLWFIIYTFKTTNKPYWLAPIFAICFEVVYVGFVFIRSLFLKGQVGRVIFPYFFLNYQTLGLSGIFKWLIIMLFTTLAVGYGLIIIKKITNLRQKK